jgi:ornithine cyclodeaminase/alanine dehydrogenase-like protein (mu-crystallin family)
MLVLSRADLERLLDPPAVIKAVAGAFREAAAGRAGALPRAVLPMSKGDVFLGMRSALPHRKAMGAKLITVVGANRARGLPTIPFEGVSLVGRDLPAPKPSRPGCATRSGCPSRRRKTGARPTS